MAPAPPGRRPGPQAARREAILLTLAAVGYSNGLAWIAMRRGRVADAAYRWTNPLFLPLLLWAAARARRRGLGATLHGLGLQRAGWPVALGGGAALGLGLAAPALGFFARPVLLDAPLEYGPIGDLAPGAFRRRVLLE